MLSAVMVGQTECYVIIFLFHAYHHSYVDFLSFQVFTCTYTYVRSYSLYRTHLEHILIIITVNVIMKAFSLNTCMYKWND